MKKYVFLFLIVSLNCFANIFPIGKIGQKSDFIPKNWEIVFEKSGDLNKDGKEDIVLVIQNLNKKAKYDKEDVEYSLEKGEYFYPRAILVLFRNEKENNYTLVSKNHRDFEDNKEEYAPYLFFDDLGEIEIKKNVLRLYFQGYRHYSIDVYRWQNNRMELIGSEGGAYIPTVVSHNTSINYSTGVRIDTKTYMNGYQGDIVVKRKFKINKKYSLEDLNEINNEVQIIYEPVDKETERKLKILEEGL